MVFFVWAISPVCLLAFSVTMMRWLWLVTFHFAFQSHGTLFVSAHSASPHRHGYNFSQFSFVRTSENSHIKIQTLLFARWCRRKSSCDKEIWLESSKWTLEQFMTTLVLFPTFHLWTLGFDSIWKWITFSSFGWGIQLISFFGDGPLVFLLCRTGSLHRRSNDLISVEMCDFAIWGLLCEFWKFFRSCNASSWEQGSLSEALSWMLPPLCHNKVRLIDSACQKTFLILIIYMGLHLMYTAAEGVETCRAAQTSLQTYNFSFFHFGPPVIICERKTNGSDIYMDLHICRTLSGVHQLKHL